MRAMVMRRVVDLLVCDRPLELVRDWPDPTPDRGEVTLQVAVCGVCHTELDELEGRTVPDQLPRILGHEVVGRVAAVGPACRRHQLGDRLGVGWIHCSSGDRQENLSPRFRATGRDADGGYAEYMTVPEDYAYPIPDVLSDVEAAPLLCAGAIGYRALRLTQLEDGQPLGLTGFGGSAHLVLQLARHLHPQTPVYVFARDPSSRAFALSQGAVWAGDSCDRCPTPLRAVIDTTPAWKPVVAALENLAPGGRLVINAIRKEAGDQHELLKLDYERHLWMEREIKSVANITQFDIREFLPLAASAGIRPEVTSFPLEDANRALIELKRQPVRGAKVLRVS